MELFCKGAQTPPFILCHLLHLLNFAFTVQNSPVQNEATTDNKCQDNVKLPVFGECIPLSFFCWSVYFAGPETKEPWELWSDTTIKLKLLKVCLAQQMLVFIVLNQN